MMYIRHCVIEMLCNIKQMAQPTTRYRACIRMLFAHSGIMGRPSSFCTYCKQYMVTALNTVIWHMLLQLCVSESNQTEMHHKFGRNICLHDVGDNLAPLMCVQMQAAMLQFHLPVQQAARCRCHQLRQPTAPANALHPAVHYHP